MAKQVVKSSLDNIGLQFNVKEKPGKKENASKQANLQASKQAKIKKIVQKTKKTYRFDNELIKELMIAKAEGKIKSIEQFINDSAKIQLNKM